MSLLKKHKPAADTTQPVHKISVAPHVLLSPIVSEKASMLQARGQYTFAALPGVSKVVVKKLIEATYGVHVVGVNSLRLPRKTVRRGKTSGRTRVRRHVIVRLGKGESITLTSAT